MPRKKQIRKQPRDYHKEYLDPTPIEIPVGFQKAEPLRDSIKRMVKEEFSVAAERSDMETFEEADDFENEEEDEFLTPYTVMEMTDELESELIQDPLGEKPPPEEEEEKTEVDPDPPKQAGADNKQSSTEQSASPQ